jgi:hypothetical protein
MDSSFRLRERSWGYGRLNLFSSRVYVDQGGAEDFIAAKIENGCMKARQASLSKTRRHGRGSRSA